MSVLKKCLLLVVAAGMVFVILVPGSPPGQATPGAAPVPAANPSDKNNKDNDSFGQAKDKDGSVTVKGRRQSTTKPAAPTKPESSSSEPQEPSPEQKKINGLRDYIEIACHPEHPMTNGFVSCEDAKARLAEMLKQQGKQPAQPVLPEQVIAQQAVAKLTLPEVNPVVMPDPEWNQWKSYAVGEDLWLWADSPAQLSTTVTQQGITIQITAVRDKIDFDMGDGGVDSIVSCKEMTKYEPPPMYHTGPWESPTCRYYYKKLPEQRCAGYTMTATAHWTVTWSVLGQSGTIPMKKTQTKHLPIVELHALAVSTSDPNDPYDPNNDPYGDPNDPMNSQAACPRPGTTTPSQAGTPSQAPTSTPAPTSKPTQTRKPGSKPS